MATLRQPICSFTCTGLLSLDFVGQAIGHGVRTRLGQCHERRPAQSLGYSRSRAPSYPSTRRSWANISTAWKHLSAPPASSNIAKNIEPPQHCPICEDERQFVNWNGQEWTTLAQMQELPPQCSESQGERLTGIGSKPRFAIGQRALLVQTGEGNLLWDCISLVDEATVEAVRALGGNLRHRHFPSALLQLDGRLE